MYPACYSLDVLIIDLPTIPLEDQEFIKSCIENLLLKSPYTYSTEIKGSIYRKFKVNNYLVLFGALNLDKALLILAILNVEAIVSNKRALPLL